MKFMLIVKSTKDTDAGVVPTESLRAEMGAVYEEMARAGVLRDGSGLRPSKNCWRTQYRNCKRSFIDGPFAGTKELIAGYTIMETNARDRALAWCPRFLSFRSPLYVRKC